MPEPQGAEGYDEAMRASAFLALSLLATCCLVGVAFAEEGCPPGAAPASSGRQDVVVLRWGASYSGRVVEETDDKVVLETRSNRGGLGRMTFKREQVLRVERGAGGSAPTGGTRPIRDEWFLLQSGGRIVGTRHLELWSVRRDKRPAYRLDETIEMLPQGRHLPATRTMRNEITDLKFRPLVISFREVGDGSHLGQGPEPFDRYVSGSVRDGVWHGSAISGGRSRTFRVPLPENARGRLGLREHLIRRPREVLLVDTQVLEPDAEGLVTVRAGFASAGKDETARRRGHEFHWEEDGKRLISWFEMRPDPTRPRLEEIREGLTAVRATRKEAKAVLEPVKDEEIRLPKAGIAFRLPDRLWKWKKPLASPTNTGWRVIAYLRSAEMYLADVRIEWHPAEAGDDKAPEHVEGWLIRRLRAACTDLKVIEARRAVEHLEGAWRIEVVGTLNETEVRTTAVVIDRPRGRVVLLAACPLTTWKDGGQALDRFISSVHLL